MMADAGKKPRVAIVVPTHWAYLMGGSQYQAKLLTEVLERQGGVELAYFAARVPSPDRLDGQTVYRSGEARYLRRFGHFWDYLSLQGQLDLFDPDVIYQRVCCAHTGICARYAHRNRIPMIWHVANERDCWSRQERLKGSLSPHKYIETALSIYGIRNANLVIAQTAVQENLLRENFGIEANAVIPNFHPVPGERIIKSATFTVLWIGNLKPVKRPELFIEVARELEGIPGIQFKMIGAPFSNPQVQQEFERKVSAIEKLEYVGSIDQEAVNKWLSSAHLLVNTSSTEGFSNTFIQAWMRRVPVITLGVNPDDIFNDGSLGYCCNSTEDVAYLISQLWSDRTRLTQMGAKARQESASQFSMKNAEELAALIVRSAANSLVARNEVGSV
jgi:glycosyltransferase involved in cell wall biosynthesis